MDLYTNNALVNMLSKLGCRPPGCHEGIPFAELPEPRLLAKNFSKEVVKKVFDEMPERDVVSWNTVIVGCTENGSYKEALAMVREMAVSGLKPDSFTLSTILPIFAEFVDVAKEMEIHGYAVGNGVASDVFVGSSLVDMYANCTRAD